MPGRRPHPCDGRCRLVGAPVGARCHREQDARPHLHRRHRGDPLVADPAAGAGLEVLVLERVEQPARRHAAGGTVHRHQADQGTGTARQGPAGPDHPHVGRPDPRLDRDRREPRRRHGGGHGQRVVEAVAGARHHDDPLGPCGQGRVERQVEVGGVLGAGMALDPHAGARGRVERSRVHRVHVTHHERGDEPQRGGVGQPRVGRHDQGLGPQVAQPARGHGRGSSPADDDRHPGHAGATRRRGRGAAAAPSDVPPPPAPPGAPATAGRCRPA